MNPDINDRRSGFEVISVNNFIFKSLERRVSSVKVARIGVEPDFSDWRYCSDVRRVLVAFKKNFVEIIPRGFWQNELDGEKVCFGVSFLKPGEGDGKYSGAIVVRGNFDDSYLGDMGLKMRITDLDLGTVERKNWKSKLGIITYGSNELWLPRTGSAMVIETVEQTFLEGERKKVPCARVSFIVTDEFRRR